MPTTSTEAIRHELVGLATDIDMAWSTDTASDAYFAARRLYYSAADSGNCAVSVDQAWGLCIQAFEKALERHATPIQPLFTLG